MIISMTDLSCIKPRSAQMLKITQKRIINVLVQLWQKTEKLMMHATGMFMR